MIKELKEKQENIEDTIMDLIEEDVAEGAVGHQENKSLFGKRDISTKLIVQKTKKTKKDRLTNKKKTLEKFKQKALEMKAEKLSFDLESRELPFHEGDNIEFIDDDDVLETPKS